MKKLFLLLFLLGIGLVSQAQEEWTTLDEVQKQVYHLAKELNKETDKVVAQGNVISITTGKGTVSVEKKLDKSKPEEKQHFYYNLLTANGKVIRLDKMNAERVLESFQSKLLKLKIELRENQDVEVESILNSLFQ